MDTVVEATMTAVATAPAGQIARSGSPPRPVATGASVTVNVAGPQIVYQDKTGHSLFLRAIWFICVGWWLGEVWLFTAWMLNLTVIGLPLGLMMLNKLPSVMTLRKRTDRLNLNANADGSYTLTRKHIEQRPFWARALYFVCVGWWLSLIWTEIAYAAAVLVVTLPLGFMMFDRVPAVTTLARY